MLVLFILFPLLSFPHPLLVWLSFKEKSTTTFQKKPPLFSLVASVIPLLFQALLSRGVTELLLTSDNKDRLKLGGVKGGIVGRAVRQTRRSVHTHPNKHARIYSMVVCETKRCEPRVRQLQFRTRVYTQRILCCTRKLFFFSCTLAQTWNRK